MAMHLDDVIQAIHEGCSLVLVQDDDVPAYVERFVLEDPAGAEPARAVLSWDPVSGFVACSPCTDPLPENTDLAETLNFIRDYRAGAIFLIDCQEVDLDAKAQELRKPLRQLQIKLAASRQVTAVVLTARPIPALLAERQKWIGQTPEEAPPAQPPSRGSAASKEEYRKLRDLAAFDTRDWEKRLEAMQPDEVKQIVQGGYFQPALERIQEVRKALLDRFVQREAIVDAVCSAAIAQVPLVLIGPPGTAKSNIIRCFCEGLGLSALQQPSEAESNGSGGRKYFEYLLTRYTTPEEIYGPVNIQELIEKQIYRRVTRGSLPEAQVAFLDEIFKASSAILNTLLTLLNERIFYNAGEAMRVPLLMVFGASNKAPTDEGLHALYDRFPIRLNCPPVDPARLKSLLATSWEQAYDRQFGGGQVAIRQIACTNDLRLLRHVMRVMFGGRTAVVSSKSRFDFAEEFLRFFQSLRGNFAISDRTAGQLYAYCRAHALLNGRAEMTVDELDVFRHVSWDEAGTGELDRLVTNMKRGIRI